MRHLPALVSPSLSRYTAILDYYTPCPRHKRDRATQRLSETNSTSAKTAAAAAAVQPRLSGVEEVVAEGTADGEGVVVSPGAAGDEADRLLVRIGRMARRSRR